MNVKIDGNKLVIECELPAQAELSKSGKSLNVVSTGGFVPTTASFKGKPIRINVNAIVSSK